MVHFLQGDYYQSEFPKHLTYLRAEILDRCIGLARSKRNFRLS